MDALHQSRALFVQPHLDDVALSCGGVVACAADTGERPCIVGVFTGPPSPDEPLGPAARALHARWGLGDDAWRARRAEDARACEILGAAALWLPYRDAPYRGYDSASAIFGGLREGEPLVEQVAGELLAMWRRTAEAVVYLPLGVGGHVDHLICHATGASLEAAGVPVRYYEDFPYAAIPGRVSARLAELAELAELAGVAGVAGVAGAAGACVAERVDVTAWIDRRVRAADAYASQIPSLFGPGSPVQGPTDHAIRSYAGTLACGLPGASPRVDRLVECFYRRPGKPHGR